MAAAVLFAASAVAQSPPPRSGADRAGAQRFRQGVIGTWEFSNAERDKICTATFNSDPTAVGFKVKFDANCAKLFPLVRDIAGWKFPDDDLLYLLDAQGKPLIEFSEVEDGIFEAPTPGLGVLFLQNPPPPRRSRAEAQPEQIAGNWTIVRGDGAPLCVLTLARDGRRRGLCADRAAGLRRKSIAKLNFTQWRLDQRRAGAGAGEGRALALRGDRRQLAPDFGKRRSDARWCGSSIRSTAAP